MAPRLPPRIPGLRAELNLHPAESTAAATFEAAAQTARSVAVECLPLGIALVMHLYPLCALRCVPLPWWSSANLRRTRLLHAIDRRSLILANAGSERAAGAHAPVTLTRTRDGIRVDGTYDYVSLAHVADVVLFSAPLAGSACSVFCAADLRGDSVRIGDSRFNGSMRLSDTCSVTFDNHHVPTERYVVVPNESALNCMAQYQRSWFQLLLGESYLARIERLHRQWELPRPTEQHREPQRAAPAARVLIAPFRRGRIAQCRGIAVAGHRRHEAAHLVDCTVHRRSIAKPR